MVTTENGNSTTILGETDFSSNYIASTFVSQGEPQWMLNRRSDAFEQFRTMPMPSTELEAWRRTDIRGLSVDNFHPPSPDTLDSTLVQQIPHDPDQQAGLLVQQNGVILNSVNSNRGVYFADLQTALKEKPGLVETYLGQAIQQSQTYSRNRFEVMHNAFMKGGYVLYLPAGVVVENPFQVFMTLNGDAVADFSHTLIIAEANSQATIFEEFRSTADKDTALHCGAVEIFVSPNAHLNFVQIQGWNQKTWHFSTQRAIVERDANLRWVTTCLGSRLTKIDQLVELAGTGANADMLGLALADKRQHIDVHTYQKHAAPHTTSDLLYRNVLTDRSRTVWRGMIEVVPDAQNIDAYQKNDNLLLSKHARADTIPGLEILADEVRCTHGATAGQIDPEQIYYLMSRGLPQHWAEEVIISGFLEPVLQRIPSNDLRNRLEQSISHKLEKDATPVSTKQ